MRFNLTPRRLALLAAVLLLATFAFADRSYVPRIVQVEEYNPDGSTGSPRYAILKPHEIDTRNVKLPPGVQPVGDMPQAVMQDTGADAVRAMGGPGFMPTGAASARPAASTVRAQLRSVVKQLGL